LLLLLFAAKVLVSDGAPFRRIGGKAL